MEQDSSNSSNENNNESNNDSSQTNLSDFTSLPEGIDATTVGGGGMPVSKDFVPRGSRKRILEQSLLPEEAKEFNVPLLLWRKNESGEERDKRNNDVCSIRVTKLGTIEPWQIMQQEIVSKKASILSAQHAFSVSGPMKKRNPEIYANSWTIKPELNEKVCFPPFPHPK